MKFMITGGAGFIGSHIAEALVLENHEVIIFDDFSSGKAKNLEHPDNSNIEIIKGDIKDKDLVLEKTKGLDGIFHEAALVSVPISVDNPVFCFENNSLGTLHIFEAARINRVKRIVYASSAAIYGTNENLPLKEAEIPAPDSPYGLSKLNTEQFGSIFNRLYGIESVALRYFNVFGPRQDPASPYSGVISIFMAKLLNKEPITIFGDGEQTRDFIFVKDVVAANLKAMFYQNSGFKIYNVGTGKRISLNAMVEVFNELLHQQIRPQKAPARQGDIRHSLANISKIQNELGFRPQWTFKQGLENLIDYFKQTEQTEK